MRRLRAGTQQTSSGTILYVEDEPDNFEVARLRLRNRYNLVVAKNAREACDIIREKGEQIDAVLMDVQLRGSDLDGLQLARVMRGLPIDAPIPAYALGVQAQARKVPILFVTAYANLASTMDFDAVGADGVLPKPVGFADLSLALARLYLRRVAPTH